MMDSAPFPIGRTRSSVASREHDAPAPRAPDPLWREHGWGLSAGVVAALVGAVLITSFVVQLLG